MAVQRQQNWLGQQRVDVPHLRAVESGVAHDFDVLAGIIMAGKLAAVCDGFNIDLTSAIGNDAESLVLKCAGASVVHYLGTEAGSVFRTADDASDQVLGPTNPVVEGSFTPNSTNFVGLDLTRTADDSTADVVQFMNPDTDTETPKEVPLARELGFRVLISTTEFAATPGICPIAKVTTDASNKVTAIVDARHLLFRLGTGGSNPLDVAPFSWPGGRNEAGSLAAIAGDRSIKSLKNWMDATMTRLWELGGGEYWYSATADRNVVMVSNSVFTSTGEPFEIISSNVHWKGLRFIFDNSTATTNEVADQTIDEPGLTDLVDGECLYVDLDRTEDRTVAGSNPLRLQKGVLSTLGTSSRPGQRYIVVSRVGSTYYTRGQYLPVGSALRVATTLVNGAVRLSATPTSALAPVVATATGISGLIMGMSGFSRRDTSTTGDLDIGLGLSNGDHNINLTTDATQYATTVAGSSRHSTNSRSALEVTQYGVIGNERDARIQTWKSDLGGGPDDRVWLESSGAMGMVCDDPATPPDAPAPGALKFYARTNGLATPNTRDQLVVMTWDGTVNVLFESEPY